MLLYCVMIEILTRHASREETTECFLFEIKSHYHQADAATDHS